MLREGRGPSPGKHDECLEARGDEDDRSRLGERAGEAVEEIEEEEERLEALERRVGGAEVRREAEGEGEERGGHQPEDDGTPRADARHELHSQGERGRWRRPGRCRRRPHGGLALGRGSPVWGA